MIALPKNVTLVKPGESVELPDRVFAPAPYEGMVIRDGDWCHAVTLMPFRYLVQREGPDGAQIVSVFENEHDPATDSQLSSRAAAPDPPQEQWDLARQQALDFLMRMKAER